MNTEKLGPKFSHEVEGQWTTGLYDCWDDPSLCVKSCVCPCIIHGQLVEILDRGTTSRGLGCLISYAMGSIHCGCVYGGIYRSKLRKLFNLPEAPCSDYLLHCCCCVCSLSQEYRELKNRGIDPSLGWENNAEILGREGLTVPPMPTSKMTR
nr:protein PLANT CADMIUM RESISTANCE 9-like [Ipomoea batatas]